MLLAQRLGGCNPAFGFRPSIVKSHMLPIVVSQVAGLKRHGHPVHACCRTFLSTRRSRCDDAGCSGSHKGAAVKRGHNESSLMIEIRWGSGHSAMNHLHRCSKMMRLLSVVVTVIMGLVR